MTTTNQEYSAEQGAFQARAGKRSRNNRSRAAGSVIDPNDPLATAKSFSRTRDKRLIRYRGAFYTWTGTHYRQIDDEAIRRELYDFLATDCKPDDRAVNKVIDAMKACVLVSSDLKAPAWLPDASAELLRHTPVDLLAHAKGLLNVQTGEQLHGKKEVGFCGG